MVCARLSSLRRSPFLGCGNRFSMCCFPMQRLEYVQVMGSPKYASPVVKSSSFGMGQKHRLYQWAGCKAMATTQQQLTYTWPSCKGAGHLNSSQRACVSLTKQQVYRSCTPVSFQVHVRVYGTTKILLRNTVTTHRTVCSLPPLHLNIFSHTPQN